MGLLFGIYGIRFYHFTVDGRKRRSTRTNHGCFLFCRFFSFALWNGAGEDLPLSELFGFLTDVGGHSVDALEQNGWKGRRVFPVVDLAFQNR